jgi:sigma-B regulation protein RsbU (phosphoserine phosphatase)
MILLSEKDYASRLKEEKRYLRADDILLLYTDGVTEAKNGGKDQFGTERLEQFIEKHAHCSPKTVKSALRAEIESFTGSAPQSDDITFVVVRRA